jgi:hypothetical protein
MLLTIFCCSKVVQGADETIFRSGNELIVQFSQLDQWRHKHSKMNATLRLKSAQGEKVLQVNLSDRLTPEALVIDVAGLGNCSAVAIDVKDATGKLIHSQQVSPVPTVTIFQTLPLQSNTFAAIELGSKLAPSAAPHIALPELTKLRVQKFTNATRTVMADAITYPVITDADLPGIASNNATIVSRQSFAPNYTRFSFDDLLWARQIGINSPYQKLGSAGGAHGLTRVHSDEKMKKNHCPSRKLNPVKIQSKSNPKFELQAKVSDESGRACHKIERRDRPIGELFLFQRRASNLEFSSTNGANIEVTPLGACSDDAVLSLPKTKSCKVWSCISPKGPMLTSRFAINSVAHMRRVEPIGGGLGDSAQRFTPRCEPANGASGRSHAAWRV